MFRVILTFAIVTPLLTTIVESISPGSGIFRLLLLALEMKHPITIESVNRLLFQGYFLTLGEND